MSLFDFPRIHFSGRANIDPATGNNNYHFPLVSYEPVTGTVVLPPRLYLEKESERNLVQDKFPELLAFIHEETDHIYLLIPGIDTPEKFKSWNTTPLGSYPDDAAFHELYALISTKKEQKPLLGQLPGYWNYYGTLNFSFEDVRVHAIQLRNHAIITSRNEETDFPSIFKELLGASVRFSDQSGRHNYAVMIDVTPTLSLYSQVFCDLLHVEKAGHTIFEGSPVKASLRQMNPTRILNDSSITGASGVFYSCIPIETIEKGENNALIMAFRQYQSTAKKLRGLRIRYDLYHVQENLNPDYKSHGEKSNPAKCRVLGTLSPWFEGEHETIGEGRLLIPDAPFFKEKKFGSALVNIDTECTLLSIDLIGSLPGIVQDGKYDFNPYTPGNLNISLKFADSERVLVSFPYPKLTTFINKGGIFDFLLSDEIKGFLLNHEGLIYLTIDRTDDKTVSGENGCLLKEIPWRIFSDQIGLYCNEGDSLEQGFLSNHAFREDCCIHIYRFGKPYNGEIGLRIIELDIMPYSRGERVYIHDTIEHFRNGQILVVPMDKAGQKLFYLMHENEIIPLDIKHFMLETGAFINLRVLPIYKHLKAIPENELNFEHVYNEFLRHYDLIYPASGIITPFNTQYLTKIHNYLKLLMNEDSWDKYLFMPSSRDLPQSKLELLFRWLEKELKKEN